MTKITYSLTADEAELVRLALETMKEDIDSMIEYGLATPKQSNQFDMLLRRLDNAEVPF